MAYAVLVSLMIPAAIASTAVDQNSQSSGSTQPAKRLFIIGHRGAAGLAPENTLASFRKACEVGVDAIELDVFLTADDNVAVHHDYTLKPEITKTADGRWLSRRGPLLKDLTRYFEIGRGITMKDSWRLLCPARWCLLLTR